jgi:hypothetical protein
MVRKQGAWGVWWLCMLTCAIYYFVWYGRINRELAQVLGREVPADGKAWSQIVPIFSIIGLANTASRLNEALAMNGATERVSPVTACLLAPMWFASHPRYLQRRMNVLADVTAARAGLLGAPAAPAAAPIVAPGMVAPTEA